MSVSTPPPPVQKKKSGLGCLGCGCLILVVIFLLLGGLVTGGVYLVYKSYEAITSETAMALPPENSDQELFAATQQKISGFAHDVKNNQAATISLNADEINSLIAHNPDLVKKNIHVFLSLSDKEGRIQATVPTSALGYGASDGRYFNIDTSFGVHFDTATKSIMFDFHTLRAGKMTLIGASADVEQSNSSFTQGFMRGFAGSFGPSFSRSFNEGLRKGPEANALLDQAKSIEIKDGELVIETQ